MPTAAPDSIFIEDRRGPLRMRWRKVMAIAAAMLLACVAAASMVKLYSDRHHAAPRSPQPPSVRATPVAMTALAPTPPPSVVPEPTPAPTPGVAARSAPVAAATPVPRRTVTARPDPRPQIARHAEGDLPIEPYRNGTKATHLTGEALRLALIEDSAITRRANTRALENPAGEPR